MRTLPAIHPKDDDGPPRPPRGFAEVIEGSTVLLVPKVSLGNPAPPTYPVFFNEAASVNRDVSVAIAQASGGRTFCDAMAGVGARGIRAAKEVERVEEVMLVDINAASMRAARLSSLLNGVSKKCDFTLADTSSFLFSRYGKDMKYDCVDVDPFGSPARHLPAAISATSGGGILSVTATDTAALCGVYPKVASRRYGAVPLNNYFHHETAIRILLNAIRRAAATLDVGVSAVAAHSTRHYLRVYVRVSPGAREADSSSENEGYVAWCPSCWGSSASRQQQRVCADCGKKARVTGPLWTGKLTDERLVRKAAAAAKERGMRGASKTLLSILSVDRFPPWGFSIERICSALRIPSVSESAVRAALSEAGYDSIAQPFESRGLKTDAPAIAVEEAVRASLGGNTGGPVNPPGRVSRQSDLRDRSSFP